VKGAWSRWLAVAKLRQSDGASERLGVHLLVRTTRRVNLTEDGAAFLDRCRRILADLEEAEMVLRRARVTPTGRLRIDMPVSFGRLKVVPLLGAFQTEYPELSLALSFTDRYVDLVEEGIDVAIRIGALQDSSLIARRVTQTDIRRSHLLRHPWPAIAQMHDYYGDPPPVAGALEPVLVSFEPAADPISHRSS
jgi:DNA-binding transcriptional LysR family regulator